MNIVKKIFCRLNQAFIRALRPTLPYREPELLGGMDEVILALIKHGVSRLMLVTDREIRDLGLSAPLEKLLNENTIAYTVYDGVESNPTSDHVEEGKDLYLREGCEALIAFGGGSVIDCAKGIGVRLARPDKPLRKMEGLLKVGRDIPLLIAIPTTAGTGSEATLSAVVADPETRRKYVINDFHLIPRYAVHAPEVTAFLPRHLTAITGMDALTHAVEVYIGRSVTKETRVAAEQAVKLIFENLETAYANGADLIARKNMLHASYLAGKAFARSYVGYVHAVAHSIGGYYGIPHGLANAVLMPYVLREYGSAVTKPLGRLAKTVEFVHPHVPDDIAAEAFISHIEEINRRMQLPATLKEVRREDIPMLAKYANRESNPLYPVPVLWNAKELERLYEWVLEEESEDLKNNVLS